MTAASMNGTNRLGGAGESHATADSAVPMLVTCQGNSAAFHELQCGPGPYSMNANNRSCTTIPIAQIALPAHASRSARDSEDRAPGLR